MQDRYTIKSREALEAAGRIADDAGHNQLDIEHILASLVRQEDGIVPHLLSRLGVTPSHLDSDLQSLLDKKPRAYGDTVQISMSPGAAKLMRQAEKEADKLKDEYISVEHFLLAIASGKGVVTDLLTKHGANYNALLSALKEVRGGQRVTDQDP
ncbi:MAG: type VI secretion system ATPase TssH, partial [Spirochaetaceae bacterium]|nr:type VI secretion system ATPase TssH [Spirochaetaceae bacterium]